MISQGVGSVSPPVWRVLSKNIQRRGNLRPIKSKMLVKIIDPSIRETYNAHLIEMDHGYRIERAIPVGRLQEPEIFLSPGWIDFHTHVYHGASMDGLSADSIGLKTGVHLVVDAGSAGCSNILCFRQYVAQTSQTLVKSFINICSYGVLHRAALSDLNAIDVPGTVKAVEEHRPFIHGIKALASGTKSGALGVIPLKLALLAAREANVPVMVHIGEAPPQVDEVLDLLEDGSILSHCFNGRLGFPWEKDGTPIPAMRRALQRGVILDVAHGKNSFSFDVCRKAINGGYYPDIISTDLHGDSQSIVHDLATTMTKILWCGMPIEKVIQSVTLAPAKALNLDTWCDLNGQVTRATLFRLSDKPVDGRRYVDSQYAEISPGQVIVPTAVISDTRLITIETQDARGMSS